MPLLRSAVFQKKYALLKLPDSPKRIYIYLLNILSKEMIKSRFRTGAIISIIFLLLSTAIIYVITIPPVTAPYEPDRLLMIFVMIILVLWTIFVVGELRTRAISATIDKQFIDVRVFFGLGPVKRYYFHEFYGYTTSILTSKNRQSYEYLQLIKNGKNVIHLSQFYHQNYGELKAGLDGKIKYRGRRKANFLLEIKERFA